MLRSGSITDYVMVDFNLCEANLYFNAKMHTSIGVTTKKDIT